MSVASSEQNRVEDLREALLDNWGDSETTVDEALRRAERAPSSSAYEEMPRCPYCGSIRVRTKTTIGWKEIESRIDGRHKCAGCQEHFTNPAPSIAEYREGLREDLPEAAENAARLVVAIYREVRQ